MEKRDAFPKRIKMCKIASCAFDKGISLRFECADFPSQTTKCGPISYGYCTYLSGK
jgi:hypothetical protein